MKHVVPWKVIIVVAIILIITIAQIYVTICNYKTVEDPWENLPPNKSSIEVMIEHGYVIE